MGEFVNGSRLVYPMEKLAMRFLNMTANKVFAWAFSYVLGQRLKDTLCGTKVLLRSDWERISAVRGKLRQRTVSLYRSMSYGLFCPGTI